MEQQLVSGANSPKSYTSTYVPGATVCLTVPLMSALIGRARTYGRCHWFMPCTHTKLYVSAITVRQTVAPGTHVEVYDLLQFLLETRAAVLV